MVVFAGHTESSAAQITAIRAVATGGWQYDVEEVRGGGAGTGAGAVWLATISAEPRHRVGARVVVAWVAEDHEGRIAERRWNDGESQWQYLVNYDDGDAEWEEEGKCHVRAADGKRRRIENRRYRDEGK